MQPRRARSNLGICGQRGFGVLYLSLTISSVRLADVTRSDVLAAVKEFDKLGRDAFLDKYGFGTARTYFLEVNGRQYDSKAIMGYAHGVSQGEFLRSGDFTGGEASVVHHLRRLGFVTRTHRNPPWAWDEIGSAAPIGDI
ncbi:hypothetical protein VAB18032_07720 [Micromonospora maris AB-18-032]|nr:hypothetical protein VAB18032_07720 [Micromonospora maris AB-18-032]